MNDTKNKVNCLQYSSKLGRELFKNKIIASVIASFIIATIQLTILFVVYKQNKTIQYNTIQYLYVLGVQYRFSYKWYVILVWYNIWAIYNIISVYNLYYCIYNMYDSSFFVSSKVSIYIGAIGTKIPILFAFWIWLNDIGMKI